MFNIESATYDSNSYSGDSKLCSLLGLAMNAVSTPVCSDTPYTYSSSTFMTQFQNNTSFVTPNGMRWMIVPARKTTVDSTYTTAEFQNDVYVDVNPENNNVNGVDKSCIYDANTCTSPDIFKFMIAASGKIQPADPMGIEYSATRLRVFKNNAGLTNTNILADLDIQDLRFNIIKRVANAPQVPNPGDSPNPSENCNAGEYWDETTASCKQKPQCNTGEYWDETTASCKQKPQCNTEEYWDEATASCKSKCGANQIYVAFTDSCEWKCPVGTEMVGLINPVTNTMIKVACKVPCAEGEIRDPQSFECKKPDDCKLPDNDNHYSPSLHPECHSSSGSGNPYATLQDGYIKIMAPVIRENY